MMRNMLSCAVPLFSPFERGGNFERARNDPRALLMELRAELEEVRASRRNLQERLRVNKKQMDECSDGGSEQVRKSTYGWLIGAAVAFIFGLLFSAGSFVVCGACSGIGVSGLCIVIALILVFRALSELRDSNRLRKNQSLRYEQYHNECQQCNEQIYKLNLREAELDECIRSAQKYM